MNIEALRTLVYAAKYQNFSTVADMLHISQPAITKRIRALEGHFGQPLIERIRGSMLLTPAGQTVLPFAENIISAFDEVSQQLNGPDEWRGTIKLGVVDTILMTWLTDFLDSHRHRYPGVRIEVSSAPTMNLLSDIESGRIDIAMMLGPSCDRTLIEVPLCIMEVGFFAALPEGKQPSSEPLKLSQSDLADANIITFPRGSKPHSDVVENINRLRLPRTPAISGCVSIYTMRSMVERGIGIGTIPLPMAVGVPLQQLDIGIELAPLSFCASYDATRAPAFYETTCALAAETAAVFAASLRDHGIRSA